MTTGAPLPEHEQIVHCHDRRTGLRAIIAIHSTALGPALGGTRFRPYPDYESALADVLDLAGAMSLKNALAGLEHGGGKAVIIGDPARDKTPELLAAYGRFVDSLGGRYVTACDVGTYVADMDVVATETPFATGRSPENGGSGDSGILTAFGVLQGIRAAAAHRWGTESLAGRRVAIAGAGKVGSRLAGHLLAEGAAVTVADVDAAALARLRDAYPAAHLTDDPASLIAGDFDIYSPNALGGAINRDIAERLTAEIVCGGANNQLAEPAAGEILAARGVLYAPDFLVNCGGVIQVADEVGGFDMDRARARTAAVYATAREVFTTADAAGERPEIAAERLARQRIAAGRYATGLFRRADRAADASAAGTV